MECHTYEDVDAYGFADTSVGAVRPGGWPPVKVADQVIVANSGPLAEHPSGRQDARIAPSLLAS